MARSTGKKKTSKLPAIPTRATSPTTPIAASTSDTPNLALACNPLRTTTPLPATNPNNAALLAKLAEQEAEIDRLRKASRSMAQPTSKEIVRPGSITNLQKAMGLENDRPLYMNCRSTVCDVLLHAGIPLDVDWRRQDPFALGKVANVAKSRNNQLQLYEKNWASLEIMKTIIKNKRSYRTKIGRANTSARKSVSVNQETGKQLEPTASGDDEANNEHRNGDFSSSDEEGEDPANGSISDTEEENASSGGPVGTKRKAMGTVGNGKRQKV